MSSKYFGESVLKLDFEQSIYSNESKNEFDDYVMEDKNVETQILTIYVTQFQGTVEELCEINWCDFQRELYTLLKMFNYTVESPNIEEMCMNLRRKKWLLFLESRKNILKKN